MLRDYAATAGTRVQSGHGSWQDEEHSTYARAFERHGCRSWSDEALLEALVVLARIRSVGGKENAGQGLETLERAATNPRVLSFLPLMVRMTKRYCANLLDALERERFRSLANDIMDSIEKGETRYAREPSTKSRCASCFLN